MVRELLTSSMRVARANSTDQATRIGCFVRAIQDRKTQILGRGSSTYIKKIVAVLHQLTPLATFFDKK